jgi:hypothetical protein
MSCAVVSVNRSLSVLAVVWVLVPVAALQMVEKTEHASASLTLPANKPSSCELGEEHGLMPTLSLAIRQPNKKKAAVTNGR